jgi:hypothetical protein
VQRKYSSRHNFRGEKMINFNKIEEVRKKLVEEFNPKEIISQPWC